jgi:hypothetical protein
MQNNTIPDGYVGVESCLAAIWPDPKSRLSVRRFWELEKLGKIPCLQIGRRVYFSPSEVQYALERQFKRKAR